MRHSTAPCPMMAPYRGTKFLSTSGLFAMARKNGLGFLLLASKLARNSFCAGSTIFTAVAIRSSIEPGQEVTVSFEEVERSQFVRVLPSHLLENQVPGVSLETLHAEEDQE